MCETYDEIKQTKNLSKLWLSHLSNLLPFVLVSCELDFWLWPFDDVEMIEKGLGLCTNQS